MHLYDYIRSSAAYRVRLALSYKNIPYDTTEVHLVKDGGQQHQPQYRALNPQGLVPCLIDDAGNSITQSLAIIEYLEELHPTPALLPATPLQRARVRQVAYAIACDIHPVNNLRVLQYLQNNFGATEDQKIAWYHNWLAQSFPAIEQLLTTPNNVHPFCFGEFSLADCCLIPQVFNAKRYNFPLDPFPRISEIYSHAITLDFVQRVAAV